jgi:hypothetical protein
MDRFGNDRHATPREDHAMARGRIDRDERYPDFDFFPDPEGIDEIPDALAEEVRRIVAEYNRVQAELEDAFKANIARRHAATPTGDGRRP